MKSGMTLVTGACRLRFVAMLILWGVSSMLSGCGTVVPGMQKAAVEGHGLANAMFTSRIVPLELPVAAVELVHKDSMSSGGFSALWVSPDCTRMITISDYSQASRDERLSRSAWFEASIDFDHHDKLAGVTYIQSGQLKGLDGRIIPGAIEAMTWDGKGFLIAFDDRGQIYRYAGHAPDATLLSGMPTVAYTGENLSRGNAGLESLAALPDGRIFALWEKNDDSGLSVGWLISKHQRRTFLYEAIADPGGATALPDGGVLVLERTLVGIIAGVRVRLVHITPSELNGSEPHIRGHVVFDATSRNLDNFEGVSTCRRHGKTFALAISDNNGDWAGAFNVQSTLLMMIELDGK